MSKSRKCGSKWDLKEEHQYSLENVQDSAWSAKASASSHERESEHGSFSLQVGRNGNEWSVMKSKHGLPKRESVHGSKGGQDNDNTNCDYSKNWKTTTLRDGGETCSKKKSPTLEDQEQQNCSHSPKGDRSRSQSFSDRSRSRSPARGIKRQSGFHGRTRNRFVVSTQMCKDFMAGRCRKGSWCHFLHQDTQSHEDSWDNRQKRAGVSKHITCNDDKDYLIKSGGSTDCCTDYLKGNCRRGASCRFSHDGVSGGFSSGSINEISRGRENDKRNRSTTPERDGEREARKNPDIPCKYFAAGNCRNGNYCRFSHHGQAHMSLEYDKLQDGANLTDIGASFNAEKSWNSSKGSDVDVPNEAEKPLTGRKWSDTGAYLGATKLNNTNEKVGASKPKFSDGSKDERWPHDYDVCGKSTESNMHYKRVDTDKEEGIPRKIENVGVHIGVSDPKGAEESIDDIEMSPESDYQIHSSVNKEKSHSSESTPLGTSLPVHQKNITERASGQDELSASQQRSTEKSYYQLDHMMRGSTAAALPCGSNDVGRNSSVSHIDLKFSFNTLPTTIPDRPGPSLCSLQHSNLNAIGQSELSIPSDELNMKVPAKKQNTNTKPSGFSVHSVSQVSTADGKPEVSANNLLPSSLVGGTNGSDCYNDHNSKGKSDFDSCKSNQLQPVASSEVTKENGVVKTKKAEAENKNGLSENMDADDRTEEGKKGKDDKGHRAFKFTLVEFVKDLLKPAWKEGQIGKEAYKSIVKKVVDKVTATMQGTNIPQTPEKIDQYLSFSKPKLSKLVQAYVEKFQKS